MPARGSVVALLVFLASCGSSAASSSTAPSSAASSSTAPSSLARSSTAPSSSGQPTIGAPPGAQASCGPTRATTLAADRQVRVYSLNEVVYGCSAAHGKSFRLGHAMRSIAEARVNPVAVAGANAAYGLARFGIDTGRTSVVVRRLTDGNQLSEFPATQAVGAESFQTVGSLVVKADGAVAWIAMSFSIVGGGRGTVEVHAADAGGERVLASAPSRPERIDPGSLRLRGSTLSWTDAGATRHATLR